MKLLLARNADVNSANLNGYTSLYLAANKGYLTIVKALVQAGADLSVKGKNGKTSLDAAQDENTKNYLQSKMK